MRIARLTSINVNLLICLHAIFERLHMDYTGLALNALKVIQKRFLPYGTPRNLTDCLTFSGWS